MHVSAHGRARGSCQAVTQTHVPARGELGPPAPYGEGDSPEALPRAPLCLGNCKEDKGNRLQPPPSPAHWSTPSYLSPFATAEISVLGWAGGRWSTIPVVSATPVCGDTGEPRTSAPAAVTSPCQPQSSQLLSLQQILEHWSLLRRVAGEEAAPRPSRGLAPPGSPGRDPLPSPVFCRTLEIPLKGDNSSSEDTKEKEYLSNGTLLHRRFRLSRGQVCSSPSCCLKFT